MKRAFFLSIYFFMSATFITLAATTYYVDRVNGNDGNSGSPTEPLKSIGKGIEKADMAGDIVVVRPSTYEENLNIGESIILKSESGPDVTIIDGWIGFSSVVRIIGCNPVIEGFTLRRGNTTYGGGIYCEDSSITIRDNIIESNIATQEGGGIYCCEGSAPRITGNSITNNIAAICGGGIYCKESSPHIAENTITYNKTSSSGGGGILCWGSTTEILSNVIQNNEANGGSGGGVSISQGISTLVSVNEIVDNVAHEGGGGGIIIYLDQGDTRLHRNLIAGNRALQCGGGMCCRYSSPVITSNLIVENKVLETGSWDTGGGGIYYVDSAPGPRGYIINNTIVGNSTLDYGGGICVVDADVDIYNTILWDNEAPYGHEIALYGHPGFFSVFISYSDVLGGEPDVCDPWSLLTWALPMYESDPDFANRSGLDGDPETWFDNDYHLQFGSDCKDVGLNAAPALPSQDIDGDPRIFGSPLPYGTVEIGADEISPHFYVDICPFDPTPEVLVCEDCDMCFVGEPGSDCTLGLGSSIQEPPQVTPYGDLYLTLPLLNSWNIGKIPSNGILHLPVTVPSSWSPGEKYPFQALVGLVLTNLLELTVVDPPPPPEYKYDDGSSESVFGLSAGGDMCWMHRFETIPGGETIVDVQIVFGSPSYPGYGPGNGTPCNAYVWDDPTNDGDPSDNVLLNSDPTFVQNVDSDIVNIIPLTTPVTVSGEFYVGCCLTHAAGEFVAPIDQTTTYLTGNAFYCGTNIQGGFDPNHLMNNQHTPTERNYYWCLRAGY